jgi:catechol 2,3-dioxygenase-like lactoylglutathione lyase family enzyme
MKQGLFEHVNMTVTDPDKTAQMLVDVFDWKVRWSGDSIHNGRSVHVGTEDAYVAFYAVGTPRQLAEGENYRLAGAINHLGILVDDLDAAEQRILAKGIKTHSHQTYDPGSRFYFHDHDGIEYEVVSYA